MALVVMTFVCGESQEERFESARAVVVALLPKRRRPGKTVQGFEKALARLPMWSLRRVAATVRRRLPEVLARRWTTHGFVVLGCDGSRLECPRTVALEARMEQAGKQDAAPTMWLLTSVLSSRRLPAERVGLWYRWRWESEGFFRTYKRTLNMVKLRSRTVALLHREAEGSLLATQLLPAMVAELLPAASAGKVSPRQAVKEIRREFQKLTVPRRTRPLSYRLGRAVREQRRRLTPKTSREWPRRKPHKPPGAPQLLTIKSIETTVKTAARQAA